MVLDFLVPALLWAATTAGSPSGAADSTLGRPRGMSLNYSAVMQVEEPARISDSVVARAEAAGGYFSRRTDEALELRIPMAKADAFIDCLPNLGLIVEKTLMTQSLEEERNDLLSRLKAKRAVLGDYYAMLKVSSDTTIFTIQSAIVKLQSDIESTVQQVRFLEDRLESAQVTVHFRFPVRQAPLPTGESRFSWLNGLDISKLMQRFQYGRH